MLELLFDLLRHRKFQKLKSSLLVTHCMQQEMVCIPKLCHIYTGFGKQFNFDVFIQRFAIIKITKILKSLWRKKLLSVRCFYISMLSNMLLEEINRSFRWFGLDLRNITQ